MEKSTTCAHVPCHKHAAHSSEQPRLVLATTRRCHPDGPVTGARLPSDTTHDSGGALCRQARAPSFQLQAAHTEVKAHNNLTARMPWVGSPRDASRDSDGGREEEARASKGPREPRAQMTRRWGGRAGAPAARQPLAQGPGSESPPTARCPGSAAVSACEGAGGARVGRGKAGGKDETGAMPPALAGKEAKEARHMRACLVEILPTSARACERWEMGGRQGGRAGPTLCRSCSKSRVCLRSESVRACICPTAADSLVRPLGTSRHDRMACRQAPAALTAQGRMAQAPVPTSRQATARGQSQMGAGGATWDKASSASAPPGAAPCQMGRCKPSASSSRCPARLRLEVPNLDLALLPPALEAGAAPPDAPCAACCIS